PQTEVRANLITLEAANIPTRHEVTKISPVTDWDTLLARANCCFLAVIERHGKNGNVGFGLLKNFGLQDAAVASPARRASHVRRNTTHGTRPFNTRGSGRLLPGRCLVSRRSR